MSSNFLRRRNRIVFSVVLLTVSIIAYQNFVLPEFPARNIDTKTVQLIDGKYSPTSNHLPITEFTEDGRIAISWRSNKNGPRIFIARPENVKGHLFSKKNNVMGASLINESKPDAVIDLEGAHKSIKKSQIGKDLSFGGRVLLCEKTDRIQNPTVCDGNHDCYKITVISRYEKDLPNGDSRFRLVGTDVTLKIANPKTPQAEIANVVIHENSTKIGPIFEYPLMAEPTISGDRRLLVTRFGNSDIKLSDLKTVKKNINIVYSVYDRNKVPCDVTQWKVFHPISHAHHDKKNNMKNRYKFARYPIRDSLGNIVPNGEDFGASYPWMDRHAANLFFTTFGNNGFYSFDDKQKKVVSPFEDRSGSSHANARYFNLDDVTNIEDFRKKKELLEASGNTAGVSVAGFWTHGKVVLLDGLVNNSDFLFRISDRIVNDDIEVDIKNGQHRISVNRDIKLYKGKKYESVGAVREKGGDLIDYSKLLNPNSTLFSSLENRLNVNKKVFPVTPRDIVWHFGTSRYTEELAFDDYNSPFMLINAEMTAALELGDAGRTMRHLAGYRSGVEADPVSGFPRTLGKAFPALVQNSGTAPDAFMTIPYYGKINTKFSRIEPIAKGGVFGKGLWMEEKGSLHFQIPPQAKKSAFSIANNRNWYVGAFLDGRGQNSLGDSADFITLGKLSIQLKKSRPADHLFDRVVFHKDGKQMGRVIFPGGLVPWNGIWTHIGVNFAENNAPEVFFNGLSLGFAEPLDSFKASDLKNLVSLKAGDNIYLGNNPASTIAGIKGWYDEFKVVARVPTYEEACNFARGTLVALSLKNGDPTWASNAARYPASTHKTIAKEVFEENPNRKFACYTRYFNRSVDKVLYVEDHAHLKNLPQGAKSIREAILGTKNMITYGAARPDFTKNNFCLSCHDSAQPFDEMSLIALKRITGLKMQDDKRRQPMQPDALMRGVIPADYFDTNMPSRTIASGPIKVDQFLHPKRTFIDLQWTQLGPNYLYAVDIQDASSGPAKNLVPCIGPGTVKNSNSYRLEGTCLGKFSNEQFPLNHRVRVRICYSLKGKKDSASCSIFKPLNLHDDGVLEIHLTK